MDCRTARVLLTQTVLPPADEQQLAAHFATCAACADDNADPIGALLRQTPLPSVHPPPMFTANVIARLPQASPLVLQRQTERRQRVGWTGAALAFVVAALVLVNNVLGTYAVTLVPAVTLSVADRLLLRFALVAKATLVLATSPLVLLVVLATAITWLALRRLPRQRWQLGGAAAVSALALLVIGSYGLRTIQTPVGSDQAYRSLTRMLVTTSTVNGDVVSLFGDVTVRNSVGGDVVALFGQVKLEPGATIGGSVLAGAGTVHTEQAQIGGVVVDGLGPLTGLANASLSADGAAPSNVAWLGSVFAVLITLVLAVLWRLLQPQRVRDAAQHIRQAPIKALLWGFGALVVLAGLVIGGALVLAATLVGVVLIPVLVVLAHAPFVQGIATIGQALGRRLTGNDHPTGAFWGIGIQAVVVIALALVAPLASLAVFYVLGSWGVGAALLDLRGQVTL